MNGWPQNLHYHPLAVALVSCRKEEKTVMDILDHGKSSMGLLQKVPSWRTKLKAAFDYQICVAHPSWNSLDR